MAAVPFFSTNLDLTVTPDIDQKKYPEIWADNLRLRNAIKILQGALDAYTGALSVTTEQQANVATSGTVRLQNIARVYCVADNVIGLAQLANFYSVGGVLHARLADAFTPNFARAFCSSPQGVQIGQMGEFTLMGAAPYFSGLTPGNLYYLSDVAGNYSLVPGTNLQKIGFVLDPTTIFIRPDL